MCVVMGLEIAQGLRTNTILAKDTGSTPIIHVQELIIACRSSSWAPDSSDSTNISLHSCTYTTN